MTADELAAIEARLAAITPGPWSEADCHIYGAGKALYLAGYATAADRDFTAHAPAVMAALLAEVERLQHRARPENSTCVHEIDHCTRYPTTEADAAVLQAELSHIDNVLARRAALDDIPTRARKIERAIVVAGQADELKIENERLMTIDRVNRQEWDKTQASAAALRQALLSCIEHLEPTEQGWLKAAQTALATDAGRALLEELAHTKDVLDRERQEYGRMLNELARKDRVVEAARELMHRLPLWFTPADRSAPCKEALRTLSEALAAHDTESSR